MYITYVKQSNRSRPSHFGNILCCCYIFTMPALLCHWESRHPKPSISLLWSSGPMRILEPSPLTDWLCRSVPLCTRRIATTGTRRSAPPSTSQSAARSRTNLPATRAPGAGRSPGRNVPRRRRKFVRKSRSRNVKVTLSPFINIILIIFHWSIKLLIRFLTTNMILDERRQHTCCL